MFPVTGSFVGDWKAVELEHMSFFAILHSRHRQYLEGNKMTTVSIVLSAASVTRQIERHRASVWDQGGGWWRTKNEEEM